MSVRRAPDAGEWRTGVVMAVTFHGADDATVFRAQLAPDLPRPGRVEPQETLSLVWHGRDRVTGVMPGAWLRLRGRVHHLDGEPTVHNPEFHLLDEAPSPT
ncbi:hypothetical protein [Micrococcus lacusdianchii]|uniref:hypothetical protein n=1 Tax=Micrococcus lacusdianchii TaxID=2915940 RepID=UPI0020032A60